MLLNEELALALGWKRAADEPARSNGLWEVGNEYRRLLDYAGSLAACAEAEAEIARRGLQADYLDALSAETGWGPHFVGLSPWGRRELVVVSLEPVWSVLTAPPDVRVRAMLRALGEG